jgi:hypothetical protein
VRGFSIGYLDEQFRETPEGSSLVVYIRGSMYLVDSIEPEKNKIFAKKIVRLNVVDELLEIQNPEVVNYWFFPYSGEGHLSMAGEQALG